LHNSDPASFVEDMIDELLTDDIAVENTDKDDPVDYNNEDTSMNSIQLDDECSIYEIAQIHQKIHDSWQAKTDLTLDVSAVSSVDASFIQLIASCKKMAMDKNLSFKLLNPSETVSNKIDAMFMNAYIDSDETAEK